MIPTKALLFRFSALTFNAHRIHIDPQYCQEVEGYRNLLVHGPLTVILMLSAVRSMFSDKKKHVKNFSYKNLAPLYVDEPMKICIRKILTKKETYTTRVRKESYRIWIEGKDEQLAARGTAEVGDID
jgi:hydroxyacyl-ACP dehydratase HTD2-like protein with hotdog domain